jgi:hypothetical protein
LEALNNRAQGEPMGFDYKGFHIDPAPRQAASSYIAHAAVHLGASSRHPRKHSTPRVSGEIGRFETADEAVKCALDWAVSWIDRGAPDTVASHTSP